MNDKPAINNQL